MRENRRGWLAMVALLLIVALVAVPTLGAAQGTKERFKWAVMDKMTVLEGGATFNSGATFGYTVTLSSAGVDLDGNNLVIDADGDSILVEESDDLVTFTPGAATGSLEVRTGNLQVGDETPTETHNGEDFYVEGISEFDGTAYFDGAVDMDSTLDVASSATVGSAVVGGGYGATGCTLSAAGVLQCNGAATTDGTLTAADAALGGGYGATGCTISSAGVLQCNGAATTDGALTADSGAFGGGYGSTGATISSAGAVSMDDALIVGGGYGATGCTLSAAGVLQCNGAATTDGTLTAADAALGGGYGATGCTISSAGVLQCNGAATTDGTLTAADAALGGGYGATGCTISGAGVLQCNGAGTIDGDLTVDGTANLDDVDIDLSASMNIDGHMVDIGTGTYATANGDDDLGVAGDLEVDGAIDADGTLNLAGAATLQSDVTLVEDTSGGNKGAKTEYIGLPRIKLVGFGQGTNPGAETVACMDTTPTGEWTEVDAGTNLVVTADTDYYRDSTNSIKIAFTDVVTDDGLSGAIPAQDDLSGLESVGFWVYSDVAISSGDFELTVDDSDGTDQVYTIGAVTADIWTWLEVDISGCDANCDTTDNLIILATGQGANALTEANIYIDAVYYWDSVDEDALGTEILRDGVLSIVDTEGGATLAEYTDYIVHEESGNDFVVWITDQSAADVVALVAY